MVDYFALIHKYIAPTSQAYRIYLPHAVQVTHKALALARKIDLGAEEMRFIEEAAMLHDIGIVAISAPEIGCTGDLPYICHGTEGRKMLEAEGLPRHALVCERHLGVGLSLAEIVANRMPLPHREMIPESPEEEIVCLADLFFSKNPHKLWQEKTLKKIIKTVRSYGHREAQVLDEWIEKYRLD